jgi:hypothetical protein
MTPMTPCRGGGGKLDLTRLARRLSRISPDGRARGHGRGGGARRSFVQPGLPFASGVDNMRSLAVAAGEEQSKAEDIANRECSDKRRKLHGRTLTMRRRSAQISSLTMFVEIAFGSRSRDPCRRTADFEMQPGVRGGARPCFEAAKAVRFLAFFITGDGEAPLRRPRRRACTCGSSAMRRAWVAERARLWHEPPAKPTSRTGCDA